VGGKKKTPDHFPVWRETPVSEKKEIFFVEMD
jgi:hypothetical protein